MDYREFAKRWLRGVGLEVHRATPAFSPIVQINAALRHFAVDLVFDVGANEGQFALDLRSAGYQGRIVSFEPLSTAHRALTRASESDVRWVAYNRCALGAECQESAINVAQNSVSSSILPILDAHLSAAPEAASVGREHCSVVTLDSVAGRWLDSAANPFLKMDTQGYEWAVLDGAKAALPRLKGVLVEMSLVQLYEGQRLWRDVVARLEADGFVLWSIQPGFQDQRSGRTLQVDGLFFRTALAVEHQAQASVQG